MIPLSTMKELATLRILWTAVLSSSFLLLSALLVVSVPRMLDTSIVAAFGTVAIANSIGSFVVPAMLHRAALMRVSLETGEEEDPTAMPGMVKTRRVALNAKQAAEAAFLAYQTPFILGLALSESVAMFGFALGFLGAPPSIVAPFFGVTWVLIAVRYPTFERVVAPAERAIGVRIPRSNA